jgi:hypothetical protein
MTGSSYTSMTSFQETDFRALSRRPALGSTDPFPNGACGMRSLAVPSAPKRPAYIENSATSQDARRARLANPHRDRSEHGPYTPSRRPPRSRLGLSVGCDSLLSTLPGEQVLTARYSGSPVGNTQCLWYAARDFPLPPGSTSPISPELFSHDR